MKLLLQHGAQQLDLGEVQGIAIKQCCGHKHIALIGDDLDVALKLSRPIVIPAGQFGEAFALLSGDLERLAELAGGQC